MGKESIILGMLIIVGAVWLYLETSEEFTSILFALFGIFLIIFNKEENKIERRKDQKWKAKY